MKKGSDWQKGIARSLISGRQRRREKAERANAGEKKNVLIGGVRIGERGGVFSFIRGEITTNTKRDMTPSERLYQNALAGKKGKIIVDE